MDGMKNYALIVLNNPYPHYLFSSILVNAVYVMKNVLIGFEIKEIGDLMSHQKNWEELNLTQKFFFVLVICLIVFTFIITGIFSFWARSRMKSKIFKSFINF